MDVQDARRHIAASAANLTVVLKGFTGSGTGRKGSIQPILYLKRERNASLKLPHTASSLSLTLKKT